MFESNKSPTVWFSLLEKAIRSSDQELLKQAESKLAELGFDISVRPVAVLELQQEGAA